MSNYLRRRARDAKGALTRVNAALDAQPIPTTGRMDGYAVARMQARAEQVGVRILHTNEALTDHATLGEQQDPTFCQTLDTIAQQCDGCGAWFAPFKGDVCDECGD